MNALRIAFWFLVTLTVVAVMVSLISLNQEPTTVSIFTYTSPEAQKWVVLTICVLIGAVISALFFLASLIVSETRNIRLRRANRLLERALNQANPGSARSLPTQNLTSSHEPSLEEDV
jgi:uncharacterized metal-binding protein